MYDGDVYDDDDDDDDDDQFLDFNVPSTVQLHIRIVTWSDSKHRKQAGLICVKGRWRHDARNSCISQAISPGSAPITLPRAVSMFVTVTAVAVVHIIETAPTSSKFTKNIKLAKFISCILELF